MKRSTRINLIYWIIAALGILSLHSAWNTAQQVENIAYSEFHQLVRQGKVDEVVVGSDSVRGVLKEANQNGRRHFVTVPVNPEIAADLQEHGVKFSGRVESSWLSSVLSWVLPMALFLGVWLFLIRRFASNASGGNFMSIGKSNAKVYVETDTKTTFADVAGVDEAKEELQEIVAFLKDPASYGRLGARMPKGVLLVGPPGTGKTLLAKAVAGEAGVPFFSISGSQFVEMFVGVGAARVRDLFEQARKKAPAIVFIDELDALGRARGGKFAAGGHDEKEQTLNQLLVELDGFDASSGIVLLGATNRPEVLDRALLRAGRFDRQVLVDRPDRIGRKAILDVHGRKVALADDASSEQVAALTPGFTGADLANLVNEAALAATRRGASRVTLADFNTAIERIIAGLEKRHRLLSEKERRIVSYHEMGHALVAAAIPGTDPVHKVSIIPRGLGALGYTIQRPAEDRFLMTREDLENKMAVLMGGRAAEALVFRHLSTGASDDLVKSSDIARSMVLRFGMVEELGHTAHLVDEGPNLLGQPFSQKQMSEQTAREVDVAVRALLDRAFQRATDILVGHQDVLEDAAKRLLEEETLDESQLADLFARLQAPSSPEDSSVFFRSRAA
jgi:cell division protease FtsH